MVKASNPYKILKIKRTADGEAIKRAYRRESMKHHPDRNPGDERARERFEAAKAAYRLLLDPVRRAKYDQTGQADEERPDNTLAIIVEVLSQALEGTIAHLVAEGHDPLRRDLAADVRKTIAAAQEKMKSTLLRLQKIKTAMIGCSERFSAPDGEPNHLANAARAHLETIGKKMTLLEAEIGKAQKALDFVKRYKFRFDGNELLAKMMDLAGGSSTSSGHNPFSGWFRVD